MNEVSRRVVLRLTAGAAVATAVGAAQVLRNPDHAEAYDGPDDETYRGRRIKINRKLVGSPGRPLPMDAVKIDDMSLHTMINADNTFTTVTHHYRRFKTLRAASRAAVDSLGTATLQHLHGN